MTETPPTTRTRQITTIERHIQRLQSLDNNYIKGRLVVFLTGSVLSLALFSIAALAGWVAVVVSTVAFGFMVSRHHKIRRTLIQFQLWREIKMTHIARLHLDWAKLPPALPPSSDHDHPFETDLDLTGDRSLHHLLDTAVSREGGLRLRDRLLTTPPDEAIVTARQALVRELLPLTHFRDRLTLSARLIIGRSQARWDARWLLDWFDQPPSSARLRLTLWTAAFLAGINIVLLVLNQAGILLPLWKLTFVLYVVVYASQMRNVLNLFEQSTALHDVLAPLVEVAHCLETRRYHGKPYLTQLGTPFLSAERPSVQLRRIVWLVSAASFKNNPVIWLALNALIPWDLFVAYRLNRYRAMLAVQVPHWLETWFELETASALATFAVLNPTATFPRIASNAVFKARGLGHPLIPSAVRVCNDFSIDNLGTVTLMTGSNMSGKSSFLRTIGVTLCLAYAGAPVMAESLEVGMFRVFSCIRLNDSLADGFSYFYAEVRRLRALLTALEADQPLPLFFLIDEIFRATNNQERLIGSRSYLRTLLGKAGVGIVSTHDLELTSVPGLVNYHFEDQVVDGQMTFDYRLRSGPSPTTNALKIMRLAGLPIEE